MRKNNIFPKSNVQKLLVANLKNQMQQSITLPKL